MNLPLSSTLKDLSSVSFAEYPLYASSSDTPSLSGLTRSLPTQARLSCAELVVYPQTLAQDIT
jgi:hypothetical protein